MKQFYRDRPRPACLVPAGARRGLSPAQVATCALCAALLPPLGARAQEAPPWRVGADFAVQHDSNLYRLGDRQQMPAGASRSDTITVTGVEAEVDKRLGRQHLHANIRLADNRYAANDSLNSTSRAAGIALDWETMGNLSGRLGFSDDKKQYKFNGAASIADADIGRNIVNTRSLLATARLGSTTRLGVDMRLQRQEVSYSAATFDYREFHQDIASLGLSYRRQGRFSLGLLVRSTEGLYPRFRPLVGGGYLEDRFSRQDIELAASWVFTPSNRVQAALGPSTLLYDRDGARDASAWTGHLGWDVEPTGRLTLRMEGGRDFGQSSRAVEMASTDGYLDYSRTTTYLRLNAREALTGKLALQTSAGMTRRQITNTLGALGAGVAAGAVTGHDDTVLLSAGLRWTPLRYLQLGCDMTRERRRSDNVLSTSMSSHSLGCSARLGVS